MHASINIAQKLIELSGPNHDLTPMKLLKLVYIAHGWMLGLYNQDLISEDIYAWQYGPVIPELYNAIKSYGGKPVDRIKAANPSLHLLDNEETLLKDVLKNYKKYDGVQLSSMTHANGTPWDKTWKENSTGTGVIDRMCIIDYYADLADVA